ncbi:MAG: hypothetical protein EA001_01305 [Oscillatoriales cyanobacterium]|nr:MAG: hypothetical protein EA001_01305 [Oscillatoriales cyanobacterium]
MLVAILMFGGLLGWLWSRAQGRVGLSWWQGATSPPVGQPSPAKSPAIAPSPSPIATYTSSKAKPSTPQSSAVPIAPAAPPRPSGLGQPPAQGQLAAPAPGPDPFERLERELKKPPEPIAAPFSDVNTAHWAFPFVDSLRRNQVLSGFDNGSFKPDEPVTRAQLAATLHDAWVGTIVRSPLPFPDLSSQHWAKGAVDRSVELGLMRGYPNGQFVPDRPVSRLELYITLVSGLKLPAANATAMQGELTRYRDGASLANWAKPKIAAASAASLVTYYPQRDRLDGQRPATRADVAAALYQALVYQKRLAPIQSPYLRPQP